MNNQAKALPTFIVIDFESNGQTGADGKWDTASQLPTEVAAVRVAAGEITSTFNTLIEYDADVHGWTPHLASSYNHHSQDDLRKGMPPRMLAGILWNWLMHGDVVVAYNAMYDLEMLYRLFERELPNQAVAMNFKDTVNFIDPLTIARDRHPYPHKLGDMCKLYGIPLEDAHLALDDALATVTLVLEMHKRQDITEYLNVAGYKAQYGAPTWVPKSAILKPQGNITVYHTEGGADVKTTRAVPKSQRNLNIDGAILTGTLCSVCRMPQYTSPGGDVCENGHGGVEPYVEPPKANVIPRKKAPALPKFVPADPK